MLEEMLSHLSRPYLTFSGLGAGSVLRQGLSTQTWLSWNCICHYLHQAGLEQEIHLCFLSSGIKGMLHHAWLLRQSCVWVSWWHADLCTKYICLVPKDARKWDWLPWNWIYRWL